MKTRSIVLAVVVVALVAVSTASAIETGLPLSRYLGLGGAGLALTRDAGAVDMNPGALGGLELNGLAKQPGDWQFQIAGTGEVSGDQDAWGIKLAGGPMNSKWGFGFSYFDASPGLADMDGWTFGAGTEVQKDVMLGVSVTRIEWGGDTDTIYNLGALFRGDGLDWGIVVNDITDESGFGPFFSAGASAVIAPRWIGVVDVLDITDELDQTFALGVEYAAQDNLALRLGVREGLNFSAGVGFKADRFSIDAAWMEMDDEANSFFITAATTF